MSRIDSQGFVVRRIPFRETSELIYWFTPGQGIVHTLAKGIHREKSPFKGCFDLLDLCEIGYSTSRREEGLALLTAARPLWRGRGLRCSSARLQAAYVATDVIRQFVQLDQEAASVFTTFQHALELLETSERAGFVLAWFRLRSLVLFGHRPELTRCTQCGGEPTGSPRLDLIGGGILCLACQGSRHGLARITRSTLTLMAALIEVDDPTPIMIATPPLTRAAGQEVSRFLRDYTAHVLERRLVTES